jgi:[ribosomal protein S5]-alanine N-acetyltransferase
MARAVEEFPAFITQRLHLRRIEQRDVSGLHACFGDQEAMRFWNFPASRTPADTEKTLAWLAKTTSPYDHLAWAIADQAKDQCIGMVNYHHREARNKRLELGYFIAPRHQGQGFGTEAVQSVLDYCVGRLGVHRVQAFIHPDNRPSIRLVERLGFRCEGGPLADYWCVGDRYLSAMLYAFVPRTEGGVPRESAHAKAGSKHRRKTGRPGA